MKRIAIFASGAGSNAGKIIEYLNTSAGKDERPAARVVLIVSNKPGAGVLKIAEMHQIDTLIIDKPGFYSERSCLDELNKAALDLIVLAGFLWKIPPVLIQAYPKQIINIHPALLPKYGGKGMYGHHVHEAVITNREKESGISIHYVDEIYDHGQIIRQVKCPVESTDTPESLAKKIQALEHRHYPEVVAALLTL